MIINNYDYNTTKGNDKERNKKKKKKIGGKTNITDFSRWQTTGKLIVVEV